VGDIAKQVAVVVEACDWKEPVLGLVESGCERNAGIASFAGIPERIEAERLAPDRAAVGAL